MKKNESLTPWLVAYSDLRRYLGRAFDRCGKGGVVLFYYKITTRKMRGQRHLMSLAPYPLDEGVLLAAVADYSFGRYRRVVLADLPPRGRRKRT